MAAPDGDGEPGDGDFPVMAENWDTVMAFLSCRTAWRLYFPPLGGAPVWLGLSYPDVDVVIRHLGHEGEAARRIFAGIQVMEAAALAVFHPPAAESAAEE